MYEKGVINERKFAVHFDEVGGSTVEFGGYSPDKMIPNMPMTFLELQYSPFWQISINAIRVGEKPTFANGAKSAFYFGEKKAILDTFTPYIRLPRTVGQTLFSTMFHDQEEVRLENGLLMGSCDTSKYSSINFFVNDRYYVKLQPESFVIDIGVKGRCFVPIDFNSADEFVLGEPFFRNFYTVLDDSKGLIGLAPSINFLKAGIIEGMVPNDELPMQEHFNPDD